MVIVKKEGIILQRTALGFESEGVLNPAVISDGTFIHMFYRAVAKGNYSTVGYCKLDSPLNVVERSSIPVIFPQSDCESHGVEDPRIVKIDDIYFLTYTAYDGVNALGALAISKDLVHFEKLGIITPKITFDEFRHHAEAKCAINEKYLRFNNQGRIGENKDKRIFIWDKNVIFFPRRINGKLHFLHRVKPDMQLVAVHNLDELTDEYFQHYFMHIESCIVLAPKYDFDVSYLGGGCPPIETEFGWLIIYHGVHDTIHGYVYSACAALLDLENPVKEIARLPYPLFKPDQDWELTGYVNNVCFPTGTILLGDTLYIYYGAADAQIACASVSISALLKELILNTPIL